MPLVNCTAYRMLVSPNGAQMRQGDVVLIWGAAGGLGGFALQYVLNGGGYPVCVVSRAGEGAEVPRGGRRVGHRPRRAGLPLLGRGRARRTRRSTLRLGKAHPRADAAAATPTSSSSTPAATRSARASSSRGAAARSSPARRRPASCTSSTTATCGCSRRRSSARTSPTTREGWAANELVPRRAHAPDPQPKTYPLAEAGQAADDVHGNAHLGKVGVLCIAPSAGQGVLDASCASSTSARSRATASRGRARGGPRARGAGSPSARRRARWPTTRGRR